MPETKPPVSQTKTAEQSIETAQKIREYTYGKRGPVEGYVEGIAAIIEAAKESELAALREQLAESKHREADATSFQQAETRRLNVMIGKLTASERIAEGLVLQIRRYKAHHTMLMQLAKDQNCDCAICKEAESVLARYQASERETVRCHVPVLINNNPYTSTYCWETLNDNGECSVHGQQLHLKPDWMSEEQWIASWKRLGRNGPPCSKTTTP